MATAEMLPHIKLAFALESGAQVWRYGTEQWGCHIQTLYHTYYPKS